MSGYGSGSAEDVMPAGPRRQLYFGLDLGQASDWTALCITEARPLIDDHIEHQVRHLERWRGERYPAIVRRVGEIIEGALKHRTAEDPRRPAATLVVDHTGVGRPVVDMFVEAELPAELVPVTITAGSSVTRSDDTYGVPKRLLASGLQVALQTERVKIARSLPLAAVLLEELKNFRVKISLRGHDSYGAGADWRDADGHHDDLVLAASLAVWAGEEGIGTAGFQVIGLESPLGQALQTLGL